MQEHLIIWYGIGFWLFLFVVSFVAYLAKGRVVSPPQIPPEIQEQNPKSESLFNHFIFGIKYFGGIMLISVLCIYAHQGLGFISTYAIMILSLALLVFIKWSAIKKAHLGSAVFLLLLAFLGGSFLWSKNILGANFFNGLIIITAITLSDKMKLSWYMELWELFCKTLLGSFIKVTMETAKHINTEKFRKPYISSQGITITFVVLSYIVYPNARHLLPDLLLSFISAWGETLDPLNAENSLPFIAFGIYMVLAMSHLMTILTNRKWFDHQLLSTLMTFATILIIVTPIAILTLVVFSVFVAVGTSILGLNSFGIILGFFVFPQWIPAFHAYLVVLFDNVLPMHQQQIE